MAGGARGARGGGGGGATVRLRAEVVSPQDFALCLEGAADASGAALAELESALGDGGEEARRRLAVEGRCELEAHRYLLLHQALQAAGLGAPGGALLWVPLPSWVAQIDMI